MENNETFIFGMIITAAIASIAEGCVKILYFYWMYTNDSLSGLDIQVIVVLWLPHACLLIVGFIILLLCIPECLGNGFSHRYVILSLHFFAFSLFYLLFPAIILVLVYPTQMLATLIFTLAYLFATTTLAAILIQMFHQPKIFKLRKTEQNQIKEETEKNQLETKQKQAKYSDYLLYAAITIIYSVLLLSILYIGLLSLYSLMIGKGSAVNTAPHFVISLFPSALVSGVALIAQMIVFNGKKEHQETSATSEATPPPSNGSAAHSSNNKQPSDDHPSNGRQQSCGQASDAEPPSQQQPNAYYPENGSSLKRRR